MLRQCCVCRSSGHRRPGWVGNPEYRILSQHRMTDTSSARQWRTVDRTFRALLQMCRCLLQKFVSVCCTVDRIQEFHCIGFPSFKPIGGCNYSGLVDMDTGVPIGYNLSFPKNTVLIDGRIHVRRWTDERQLPDCVIERDTGRSPSVLVWGAVWYHGQFHQQPVHQKRSVARSRTLPSTSSWWCISKGQWSSTYCYTFSAQQIQLLPAPAYFPDMSSFEHAWDFVGWHLFHDSLLSLMQKIFGLV